MHNKTIEYIQGDHNSEVFSLLGNDSEGLTKTASYDDAIADYLNRLERKRGKIYALINALSAGEYYGANRNGDYFPERALKRHHNSFVDHGHVYKHHVNKDPKKSMGKVLFSHFNDGMKRVELIVELDKDHNDVKDIIQKLSRGEVVKTSMGCFKVGTPVILPNGVSKPIEDIKVGDEVRTHRGNIKKVTELHPRQFDGDMYTFETYGKYIDDVECTYQHPLYVIRKDDFYDGLVTRKDLTIDDGQFVEAINVNEGDILVIPKFKKYNPSNDTITEAKIAGYYLAEGNLSNQDNGVFFTIGKDDIAREELPRLLKTKVIERPKQNSDESVELSTYDKNLSNRLNNLCGRLSNEKEISEEIFDWSEESKKAFLGAYIDGDGFNHQDQLYISSCNKKLLQQIQFLSQSIGYKCTLGKNEHKGESSTVCNTDTTEWVLRFYKYVTNELVAYCSKAESILIKGSGGGNGGPYINKDFIGYKIKSKKKSKFTGTVYNFEVEGDNSYLVNSGYGVHNCKVPYDVCSCCGKKAKTRSDYCDHLKRKMGKVLEDGRKVSAVNTKPRFFDISIVTIPADPISSFMGHFGMDKTASVKTSQDKSAEDKKAEIKKQIKAQIDEIEEDPKNLIRDSQPRFTDEQIEKLSKYPLNETLSTLMGLRILPHKEDFQKLALYSINKKQWADDLEKRGEVFDVDLSTEPEIPNDLGPENCNIKVAEEIFSDIPKFSLTKRDIINRIIEKTAEFENDREDIVRIQTDPSSQSEEKFIANIRHHEDGAVKSPVKSPIVPMMTMGALYSGYTRLFGTSANAGGFTRFLGKNPWLAPIIAGGIAYGSTKLQEEEFKDSPLYQEAMHANKQGLKKTASNFFNRMLISTPLSYYASMKAEEKAMRGRPINNAEDFVRKHPLPVAFGSALAAGAVTRRLGSAAKDLKSKVKFNSKPFHKTAEHINSLKPEIINQIYNELIHKS